MLVGDMSTPNTKRTRQFKVLITSVTAIVVGVLLFILLYDKDSVARKLDSEINRGNQQYSLNNEFGFTDVNHTKEKPKGVFRIAVLGDSFIWGDGLPYQSIWSHKLEQKLKADYDSIEVLHWGKNAWSTLDEFNFVKEHGKDFDIDLLIIGWVDNDLDMGKIPQIHPRSIQEAYPVLSRICPPLASKLLHDDLGNYYADWVIKLYADQNLSDYQQLLNEFHDYLAARNIAQLCVMTPNGYYDELKQHFQKVQPLIVKAGFPCLDLYAPTQSILGHYKQEELQANAVNGHPGVLMTEAFAKEVKAYLQQNKFLERVPKKPIK